MIQGFKRSLYSTLTNHYRFGWLLALIAAPLAILRGAVMPGIWVLTQASMNYSQGFAKRGLRGALLQTLHIQNRLPLTLWMFVELFLFFMLLVLFTLRSNLAQKAGGSIVVAVIAGSFVITDMTYLAGYSDVVLGSLSICILFVKNARRRFFVALPLCALAMLIHESFLVVYLPLVLLTFLIDVFTIQASKKESLFYAVLITSTCLTLGVATSLFATLSPSQISAWSHDLAANSNITPEPFFSEILGWSLKQNILYTLKFALKRPQGLLLNGFYSVPLSIYLYFLFKRSVRLSSVEDSTGLLLGFWLVTAAPIMMVFLGTDIMRWATASSLCSYLALSLACYRLPIPNNRLDTLFFNASLVMIVLELSLARYGGFLAPVFSRIG